MEHPQRRRLPFLVLGGIVILCGLASRAYGNALPDDIRQYPGDALWALMVMLMIGALAPSASTRRVALLALAAAFAIEFSQLIRWEWLVALRQYTLGRLVLGTGFNPLDLAAYGIGVASGVLLESGLKAGRRAVHVFFESGLAAKPVQQPSSPTSGSRKP